MQYATDEDVFLGADPRVNLFDLGHNPIDFTSRQMKLTNELMPKLLERAVKKGEGYQKARQAFNKLFQEYWRTARFAARFPGGIFVHRDHVGDPNARAPFTIVTGKEQRAGMQLVAEHVFKTPGYDPKLLNYLPTTHWSHWGLAYPYRLDYPISEYVATMQSAILNELFDPMTMDRLHDNELKSVSDNERYTLAEHLRSLVATIFSEWKDGKAGKYTDASPYIPAFRRNLQRIAVKDLAYLVQERYSGPEDARTLSRMHLQTLESQIEAILKKKDVELDDYTRAHLLDSQKRISQVLNAQLQLQSVD